jgi:hypothetical protein
MVIGGSRRRGGRPQPRAASAEAALGRVRNGLGGRCCKTRKQVDARVAQILLPWPENAC